MKHQFYKTTFKSNKRQTFIAALAVMAVMALTLASLLFPVPTYAADGDIAIDSNNFPDEQFRTHVKNHFDTDKDDYLSQSEIANTKYLWITDDIGLKSLKGVEYLSEIVQLDIFDNNANLGDVDLSHNTKLTEIKAQNSGIKSLNISGCTELKQLNLRNNNLETIDLSHNTKLTEVNLDRNKLQKLDVSHNTQLQSLIVSDNYLTALDTSKNTELNYLDIVSNYFGNIDLSHNTKLTYVTAYPQNCQYTTTMAIDMKKSYSHIDTSRISNIENGKINGSILYVSKADSLKEASNRYKVSYTYDTGTDVKGSPVTIKSCIYFGSTRDLGLTRMFNPVSGEHVYTCDGNEIGGLLQAGWNYEGDAWISPAGDLDDRKPVHRLLNPNTGDHHLTVEANEIQSLQSAGWVDEGVAFYSAGTVPIYVEFNPNAQTGAHNYTPNKSEHDSLLTVGWQGVDKPAFLGVLYTDD